MEKRSYITELSEERIGEIICVIQTQYEVHVTKQGVIALRDYQTGRTHQLFNNWRECEAWAIEQGWE